LKEEINKALDFIFKTKNSQNFDLKNEEEEGFYKIVKSYSEYKKSLYSDNELSNDFSIIERRVIKKNNSLKLLRIAAMFIVVLASFAIYIGLEDTKEYTIYSNNKLQNSTITLKDGSKIHLSSNSTLYVPTDYSGIYRRVKLEGEAFCEVIHNPGSVFYVKTENLLVKVYGTRFNVRDYKAENNASTNLIDGNIKLEFPTIQKEYEVYPGEKYSLNKKEQVLNYTKIPKNVSVSYIRNTLRFNNTTMEDILRTIGIFYDKNIKITNSEIDTTRLTCVYRDKSIDYILESIQNILDYEIEYKQDTIIVRGEK
jgi:ferric-dicitrate binding protein FerR (iron transport regulator)